MVVGAALLAGEPDVERLTVPPAVGVREVLQSAGLLFFAFAGYARIATLGGEVRDPARTVPRAVRLALAGALLVHLAVALSALLAVGAPALAASAAPLSTVVEATAWAAAEPVVRAGGAVAALSVLLSLLAGVSRTVWAMSRGGDLPRRLDAVSPRTRVPHHAELTVATVVVVLVLVVDLRDAVGSSSFTVLGYYAVTNAAALTLPRDQRRLPRGAGRRPAGVRRARPEPAAGVRRHRRRGARARGAAARGAPATPGLSAIPMTTAPRSEPAYAPGRYGEGGTRSVIWVRAGR